MPSKLVEESLFHGTKQNLNSRRTRRNYRRYRRSNAVKVLVVSIKISRATPAAVNTELDSNFLVPVETSKWKLPSG